ncbi:MAG: IS1634 family transposase, partial [Planctomycetaceae bacterium]
MFVRQKANRSGSTSVQVISKSGGYHVVKTMGSASDPQEIARLVELAKLFIARRRAQPSLFPLDQQRNAAVLDVVRTLQNASIRTVGPELILGRLFDEIGFNAIDEPLFRDVVLARLAYPTSKAKTVDYLFRYRGRTVSVQEIYRFLDRLNQRYADQARRIAYHHSRGILGAITVVFYDMTTLHFEAEDEDDLRRIGFSKNGKFQHPQIMLGLLVGQHGYPIGYDIFEGNTFEGKTLLPVLRRITSTYRVGRPVVVGDAAMLSQSNLRELEAEGFPFIVGARLRNESQAVQEEILERCQGLGNGQSAVLDREQGQRLIVSYSEKRAKKDAHNRERGLRRLRRRIRSGRLTKSSLNQRGYNKFLRMEGQMNISIDEQSIEQAARWDGLKGYRTSTTLPPDEVIESYGQLWRIEKAFRISKTDLRIRPVHHYR